MTSNIIDWPARILIIDDDEDNHILIRRALRSSQQLILEGLLESSRVVEKVREFQPDLILLDLHMAPYDGFVVMEQLQQDVPVSHYLPILVLTGDDTHEAKRRALTAGAKDFVSKFATTEEIFLRARNLLQTRILYKELERQKSILEDRVRERTAELDEAHKEALTRLALAAEYRDDDTGHHTKRVGELSALLARQLGLPPEEVEYIRLAAPLHDLGKVGIPDGILLKPGKLNDAEREAMRHHAVVGAKILSSSKSRLLQVAEQIALTHHEWYDGTGYPNRLQGDSIPIAGRIVAVADVLDALTHSRPYKEAWTLANAMDEIRNGRGRQFDPEVVDALEVVLSEQGIHDNASLDRLIGNEVIENHSYRVMG